MAFIFIGVGYYGGLLLLLMCMLAALATAWLILEVASDEAVIFFQESFRGGLGGLFGAIFLVYFFVMQFAVRMPIDNMLVGAGVMLLGVAGLLVGAALFGSGSEDEETVDEDWLDESDSDRDS